MGNISSLLSPSIIYPLDRRYIYWKNALVPLVFYTAGVCLFEFGILQEPVYQLQIIDNVVNAVFLMDILLNFNVAYVDKVTHLPVADRKSIAKKYLKTWFVLDVVSCIPYEVATSVLSDTFGYFNILRLWRLRKAGELFARLEKYSYFMVRCSKLLWVILLSVHFAAFIFCFLADNYMDPTSTWFSLFMDDFHERSMFDCYVTSIYWSMTTLSTTGYGDLHPVNSQEIIFVAVFMAFNYGLSSYIIGNTTDLVTRCSSRTRSLREKLQVMTTFGKRYKIPTRLQQQMVAHISLKYTTHCDGVEEQTLLDIFPKSIQSSIKHHLFYLVVKEVYLLQHVSEVMLFS